MFFESSKAPHTPYPCYLIVEMYKDLYIFSSYQILLTAAYINPFIYARILVIIYFSVSYPVTLITKS